MKKYKEMREMLWNNLNERAESNNSYYIAIWINNYFPWKLNEFFLDRNTWVVVQDGKFLNDQYMGIVSLI